MVESYLLISYLNDFIFCPRSIYFHILYGGSQEDIYKDIPQTKGRLAHKAIDERKYSTLSTVYQGMDVYSQRYCLGGKIDIYDSKQKVLIERKRKITTIYDGYILQLYAQYHALTEMGYFVKEIRLYSLVDNKTYPIALPEDDNNHQEMFEHTLQAIRDFQLEDSFTQNPVKCNSCIYKTLCDIAAC